MRRLLPVIVLCAVGMARHAHAQTPGLEETDIAPLADVISSMSDVEIMQMEQAVTDIVSLTPSRFFVMLFYRLDEQNKLSRKGKTAGRDNIPWIKHR